MNSSSIPNPNFLLNTIIEQDKKPLSWVTKNTAMVVVHGIGNQLPLETLDQFGRGLVKQYQSSLKEEFYIEHRVVTKQGNAGPWFDNVVRLCKKNDSFYIDLYEYYWAYYTEDQADWHDLNKWLKGVVSGAKNFYNRNAQLGEHYKDSSIFFDKKTAKFKVGRYKIFIYLISKTFIVVNTFIKGIIRFFAMVPLVGGYASGLLNSYLEGWLNKLTNVIGDITVYNVVDPKSRFYKVRRNILDGAVESLKFLIEREENDQLYYPSVIMAGHSLGSQVSYDAINKLNLLINKGEIKNYTSEGKYKSKNGKEQNKTISDQLNGYVTFGSPLDKIVFFLRENVSDQEYIRQQLLDAYHGFKQRQWNFSNANVLSLKPCLVRFLDDIKWRNYYDNKDYVSGGLDYYDKLTNIDCQFKPDKFITHSDYWECDNFYKDIIRNYLV
jgi:hypothetical protein